MKKQAAISSIGDGKKGRQNVMKHSRAQSKKAKSKKTFGDGVSEETRSGRGWSLFGNNKDGGGSSEEQAGGANPMVTGSRLVLGQKKHQSATVRESELELAM